MYNQKESDWKTFRKKVPELRERYLERINEQLIQCLQNNNMTQTEKFWGADEIIHKESKILRACLDGHSRSKMTRFISLMYRYGMITDDDLADFSEDIQFIKDLNM